MLMKIGDAVEKFGISHRSLHYWENAGILESVRGDNDYRYYDEENLQRIKQIMLLRRLRFSIPSIQEIFTCEELSRTIAVFTAHMDETRQEKEQLDALGTVLTQLVHMLKDKQDMNTVYRYLDTNHSAESAELKAALQMVFSGSETVPAQPTAAPIVDMAGVDLYLEEMTETDIPAVTDVVRQCYAKTADIGPLLAFFDFERQLRMPACTCWYKVMADGRCVGAVNLAYTGMESMLIRNVVYQEQAHAVYIFERLREKYPAILCWMMFDAGEDVNEYSTPDCEMKKQHFWQDNGFIFYTGANRRNQYIRMMKPHDEVYNTSRYRFAILDGSMDHVSFRMCALNGVDWYDNWMGDWRITDSAFVNFLIYNTGLNNGRIYESSMQNCTLRYTDLENSVFEGCCLRGCTLTGCDIQGLTIDGIDVVEALQWYKNRKAAPQEEQK